VKAAFSSLIATQDKAFSKPSGLPSTTNGSRLARNRREQPFLVVRQRQQRSVHVADGEVVAERVLFLLVPRGGYQQVAPAMAQLPGEGPRAVLGGRDALVLVWDGPGGDARNRSDD
jgi:hypothetical protein